MKNEPYRIKFTIEISGRSRNQSMQQLLRSQLNKFVAGINSFKQSKVVVYLEEDMLTGRVSVYEQEHEAER